MGARGGLFRPEGVVWKNRLSLGHSHMQVRSEGSHQLLVSPVFFQQQGKSKLSSMQGHC